MVARAWMCALAAAFLSTQTGSERAAWNRPVAPVRIIGNVYYVGAAGVSAFLIHAPEGSILLDGGLPETAPLIAKNIAALGFDIRSVKYLLNSHAHYDHSGGLAELKRLSGAVLAVRAQDAPVIAAGTAGSPAAAVDRVIRDGDTVKVGSAMMTAHLTPGHTKGCTTWTTTAKEGSREYRVLFHCSTSVVDRLIGNAGYPDIVQDYQRTFARMRAMDADVFLGPHPSFFDLDAKRKRMRPGAPNPFVDPAELRRATLQSERQFNAALAKEKSGGR